jgi:hypothetical protein
MFKYKLYKTNNIIHSDKCEKSETQNTKNKIIPFSVAQMA